MASVNHSPARNKKTTTALARPLNLGNHYSFNHISCVVLGYIRKIGQIHGISYIDYWMQLIVILCIYKHGRPFS